MTKQMRELTTDELQYVQGSLAFIPLAIPFGKGAMIGAGVASILIAMADVTDII
ncbi:hypothetical protein [Aestuariibacter sp. GS-14]|uniref:hypothetical protein n=1 Tax=Aestuariibacter sp. GS-14 TaxID=2590670 RepID=UPI0015E8717B|nr:hypothetical protein [Aestuariibacter sp. GS-14]